MLLKCILYFVYLLQEVVSVVSPISPPFICPVTFANGQVSYYVAGRASPLFASVCHLKETA